MRLSARQATLLGQAIVVCALLFLGSLDPMLARAEEKPQPLTFCAEETSMPRTGMEANGTPKGLDVAVARLLCAKLGRSFEAHWCANPTCARRCLREKRCDVILGHPLDEGAPR